MAPSLHGHGQMTSIKLRPGRLTNTVKRIAGRRLGTLLPRASSAIIGIEGELGGARRAPLMASVPFMANVLFVVAYLSVAVCIAGIMRD
jgi:hypothetical protein